MKIQIITLFPEMFDGVFNHSMIFKATNIKAVEIELINLRDFGIGPRKQVDDTPYGGGDGMLLKIEPLSVAVEHCKTISPQAKVLLMTPRGQSYTQKDAQGLAKTHQDLIIICGRYEGYDERITALVDKQICLGPYILTGGEIAAMAVVDSVVRLLPGVLGGKNSAEIESFSNGDNREYPQYTRPEDFNGSKVPEVLLSGNHAQIQAWRDLQSQEKSSQLKDQ